MIKNLSTDQQSTADSQRETPIRVLIVDDYDMVRVGMNALLSEYADIFIVGTAKDGEEGIRLCAELHPNVVFMDYLLPGMNGASATRTILEQFPGIKVIMISCFSDEHSIHNGLRAGATSYLLKNVSGPELAETVRRAFRGQATLSPEIARILIEATMRPPGLGHDLTERESQVLGLMIQGMNNHAIARRLSLSASTIKNHVSNILTKLGTDSRTQAVALAIKHKITES